MANHLIIGLGGTGGKVIREFRKRIYEEFRDVEPGHGVQIEYVYVDSSPEDLNNRADWKVLGKSVHLGESQKVNINGINMAMLDNINMYPGLKGFLNPDDLQMMKTKMGHLISAGIGGQRRRLGRTLFANNLSDRNNSINFESVVKGAVNRLTSNGARDADVTFHICAGLAGGTGSGSIIDAISQIRTWYPYQEDTKAYKIRLMLYMPEMVLASPRNDAGFYQANGYAALQEINALSAGNYHPVDITGQTDVYTGEVQRLLGSQEPFEAAYIYSNVNERGKVLDLSHGLPGAVADFLFQSIVASEIAGSKGQLGRMVQCENDGAGPENDQAGERSRSRKFLSFGITRVEYPETEVREFVTYNYARQAALQMTYNYWTGQQGYNERSLDEVGSGFIDYIKDKKNRESMMLSNSYLMLSKAIIESDNTKRWKELDLTWESRLQLDADDVQTSVEKKSWLGEFSGRCKTFYEDQFRNHGVKKFYDIQRKEIKAYSKHIRRHIERRLFDEWAAGTENSKSILEIEKFSSILIQDCGDRLNVFNQQKAKQDEELQTINADIKAINVEWNNIGWIKDAITKASDKVFSKYKTALCDYYTTQTRIEAYQYARELLQALILELTNMLEGIRAFKDELLVINQEVTEKAASKCRLNEEQDDTDIKKYEPEKVHGIVRQYISNKEYMSETSTAIRNRLIQYLGDDSEKTFINLFDQVDRDTVSDSILDICSEHASRAMEETAKSDPLNRMVGVNILDKLKQDLNTDEKLEQFVKMVIETSSTYVQFNADEKSKNFAGNTGSMMDMVQLSIPAPSEQNQAFYNKLITAFKNTVAGFNPNEDVAVNYKSNQIVVVSCKSGFPLRYLSNIKVLKDKYDRLLAAQDSDFNRMVLHTETFKEALPSLYELDSQSIRQMILKPLMLAFSMNLLAEQQDPVTGQRFICMKTKDEFGMDSWTPLGKDFSAIWNNLSQDYAKAMQLKELVDSELKIQARSNDQKKQLKQALGGVLQNQILPSLCENNQFHPDYPKYKAVAVEILNDELKEL